MEGVAECLLSLMPCDIYLAAAVILLVFANKYQATGFKYPWHVYAGVEGKGELPILE